MEEEQDMDTRAIKREARAVIRLILQRELARSGYSESWVRKNRVALVSRAIDNGDIVAAYQHLSDKMCEALLDAIQDRLR